jgi:RNA polymerase sigma factor (sigma-70 family)
MAALISSAGELGTMPPVATSSVVRQIGSSFDGGSVAGLTDRELIERFAAPRDATGEAAFAALVSRHGPMVMHICWQVLGDRHDAEDAFQAVFLVLARKARSIREPDLLGNWLYGIALRTARKSRIQIARRRRNEEAAMMKLSGAGSGTLIDQSAPMPEHHALAGEQAELLYSEIDRLPQPFRLPVVLCYFEGLTPDEAAHRLRCPAGTVRSRLARACDKLRRGLTRRGVVLPSAALATALAPPPASACVASSLCEITARAAIRFAAGQARSGASSAAAMALAREVLKSMLVSKLRPVVLAFMFVGATAAGGSLVAQVLARQAGKPDLRERQAGKPDLPIAAKADDAEGKPGPGRMFVVGRVLDPQGKPVLGASVMVYARSMIFRPATSAERSFVKQLGRASSDVSGRFRVDVPRTSSSRHDGFGAVALAPGFGVAWIDLDPDDDQPPADITLRPEQVIRGRVFDLQGQPARDVKLSVTAIRRVLPTASNPPFENFDGPAFAWTHPDDLPGWPSPAITGADGRFILHGVGPGLRVYLSLVDPRFASEVIEVNTDAASTSQPLSFALKPAMTITGRATYADTGNPVPHARVALNGVNRRNGVRVPPTTTVADGEGRFRVNPPSNLPDRLIADPPGGQPYMRITKRIVWPKGAITHSIDVALPRGVMMRGKVTEKGSGRPISAAIVGYRPRWTANDGPFPLGSPPVETMADGSFELAVSPRPGYLTVQAPTDDYVLDELDEGLLYNGRPGMPRVYAHAFVASDPKPDGDRKAVAEVTAAPRQGITVKGQVVGPDGEPVVDAWMLSRIHLRPNSPSVRQWRGDWHGTARSGRFELHGLDPETEVPVSFFEPKRKLGTTVHISAKRAGGEPIVVKLEPCATATARLVGLDGKPLAGFQSPTLISMVVTPGEFSRLKAQKEGITPADEDTLTHIDPINYATPPAADALGRIVLPALIPGATYRIGDQTTARTPNGPQLRKEFTVKPGEALELGDILIEKPEA